MNMMHLEGPTTPFVLMRHPGLANAILAHMPDGIAIIDVRQNDLPLVFCNARFLELTSLAANAVPGQHLLPLFESLAGSQVSADCGQQWRERKNIDVELSVKRPDHDALRLHLHVTPLAEGNDATYALLALQDVTLAHCAQQALRESATLYCALVASLAEGIVVQDEHGCIMACNSAAETLLGPLPEAGVLEEQVSFLREDGSPCPIDELPTRLTLKTGAAQDEVILAVQSGEGPRRWLSVHTQPLSHLDQPGTRAVVSSYVEVTQRRQAEEWACHLAFHDALTGLPNRRLLADRTRQCMERATRHNRHFALLAIELDNFQEISAHYGSSVGDLLLKGVAERLRTVVRGEDSLGRSEGNTFIILLEDIASTSDTALVAEKIRQSLSAPFCVGDRHLIITHRIGTGIYPRDGNTLDKLLASANVATQRITPEGRNRHLFLPENLSRAYATEKLSLCFQPEIDLASGVLTGLEAAVRWDGPEPGLIKPTTYASTRSGDGRQAPLCQWFLEAACDCHHRWSATGLVPAPLCVNLANLRVDECMLEMITGILEKTGMNPDLLTLAFNEEAVMRENRRIAETLEVLAAMGITLAIEDFGAGFTSINYLRHGPFRQLRIGKTFVNRIDADTNDRAAVSGIVGLAHHLGLSVVAEGVEMNTQAKTLRQLGCDAAQGFLISPPLSAQGVEELISQRQPFRVDAF